jgi:hypothetical protein
MARKKRRRLGHITPAEKGKVSESMMAAKHHCTQKFKGNQKEMAACVEGVRTVEQYLKGEGF